MSCETGRHALVGRRDGFSECPSSHTEPQFITIVHVYQKARMYHRNSEMRKNQERWKNQEKSQEKKIINEFVLEG